MPVYSVSRTNQYTTTAAIQTAANQDFMFYDGFPSRSYGTLFNVSATTSVCPATNLAYNYTNPNSLVSASVWYPYSFSMAICGGQPQTETTNRPGYAFLKLWTSAGSFLMGYTAATPTLSQQNAGIITFTISTNNIPVLATTQLVNNSRSAITITGSTNYILGFTNTTQVTDWTILARKSAQTSQSIYQDTSTGNASSAISTATISQTTSSMMGFITYNNAPVQPTSFTMTNTATGVSYSCQGNEVNSLASGTTIGAVTTVLILYSTTSGSGYSTVAPTTFTRTLVSGTTYSYTGTLTTTLTAGVLYYFKIATRNDAALAYNANGAGAPSAEASAVFGTPPQLFFVRRTGNLAWSNVAVGARNAGDTGWTHTPVYKRDPTNTFWITGATQTSGVIDMVSGTGTYNNAGDATTSGLATGGLPPYTITWTNTAGNACTLRSASGNPASTAIWFTTSPTVSTSTVQMAITDQSGQTASATTTITWSLTPTTFTFTPSTNTNYTYNGSTRSITVSPNPAAATYSVTSGSLTVGPSVGSTSAVVTANGTYTGTATSPTIAIVAATISATQLNPAATFNGSLQTAAVLTNVLPAGATYTGSLTASGTNAGSYTSSITGNGNYTGTVNGGTFTIVAATISATQLNPTATFNGSLQTAAVLTNVLPAGATYTGSLTASGTTAGSYTSSITGSGNYQGTVNGGTFTITGGAAPTGSIFEDSASTINNRILTAVLSGATATSYSWVKLSGLGVVFNASSQTCQVNSATINSTTTTMRCTITYSGGSVAPTYTWQWNII